MSNDCKECKALYQKSSQRSNYNQMTPAERTQYWENFKKLGEITPDMPTEPTKIDPG